MPQRAEAGDAAALASLDEACFEGRERWSEKLWEDELRASDRFVVVQRDSHELVAAATFQQVVDTADLHRVMVHPSRRGLGLAQQLVLAGIEWALGRGAERMLLEVRHDNDPALGLYRRLGFETIDTRPDYYGAGLDAQVMCADLPLRPRGADHD